MRIPEYNINKTKTRPNQLAWAQGTPLGEPRSRLWRIAGIAATHCLVSFVDATDVVTHFASLAEVGWIV